MDTSNHTALFFAAESNDLETAELLLRENINIYCEDDQGLTPVHILLQKRIEMFDLLNKKEDEFSNFPSCVKNKKANAKKKVQLEMSDIEKENEELLNAIHKKLEENEKFIVMLLKHKGTDQNGSEDIKILNFHAACTLKNSSIAESLLEKISNVNQSVCIKTSWYPGYSALHFASYCNVNTVRILVIKAANLMAQDVKAVTPLDICSKMFSVKEVLSILSLVPESKNILFSNGKTKMMDYLSSLQDPDSHRKFLQSMDKEVGIALCKNSPLWPGWTILHIAVTLLKESQHEMIGDILTKGADVTVQNIHGSTPVHLAFRLEKWQILELLLKHHKKAVNALDDDNLSHLHITAAVGNLPLTKKLLKSETNFNVAYRGNPLAAVKLGWTSLHTAVHTNHPYVVKTLLEKGVKLLQTDSRGFTAIHILLGGSNPDEKLVDILFASDQLKECVVEGANLSHLHVAAWKGKPMAIERLLDLGADIEATIDKIEDEELKKFEGCRPIQVVMMGLRKNGIKSLIFNVFDAYEILLQRGADILAKNLDGSSVLSAICTGGPCISYVTPLVKLLLKNKVLQQRVEEAMGMTMLHLACYSCDVEQVKQLLRKDVDVNAKIHKDSSIWPGFTPLHVVVLVGTESFGDRLKEICDLCSLLLNKKADVTVSNAEGFTPIFVAMSRNRRRFADYDLARLLIKHQRDFSVNPTDKFGLSHFHVACMLNEVEIVQKFLEQVRDIDVNQQISSADGGALAGHTPLHLALTPRQNEYYKYYNAASQFKIVNLLLNHGADAYAIDAFGHTPLHKLTACKSRSVRWRNFLIDNKDVNTPTNDGKTPVEILLLNYADSSKIKHFVEQGAQINSYNTTNGVGYMAILLTGNDQCVERTSRILRFMMNSPDITVVSTGRNAVHDAVANSIVSRCQPMDCRGLIEELMALGCNIFQRDSQGKTALHLAVESQNKEAVEALLEFGADVNVVDFADKSPISYALSERDDYSKARICKLFAVHLRKLQFFGLRVSELDAKLLSKWLSKRNYTDIKHKEKYWNRQLDEAAKIIMCERGFTLRDFLYQTGPVHLYWSLKPADRDTVDSFFKSNCLRKCNTLKGFLHFQYKNALQRRSLVEPAVNALRELLEFPIPDLCAEIVLKYLTNLDLQNMITVASVKEKIRG